MESDLTPPRRRLRPWREAILSICLFIGLCNPAAAQSKPFAINSIAFPLIGSTYLDDQPGWEQVQTVIQELITLGANDVKVTLSAGSYNTPTDNLPNPSVNLNPSDAKIVAFLRQLKAAGLQVTVVPFTNINFDPSSSLLDTVHAQPTNFNTWISAHTTAMVHLAEIAQQAGADRFAVFGDEVGPLTYDTANSAGWLNMISQIRAVFSGKLTSVLYADGTIFNGGNNHIDLTARPLIDALDIIGVGWFPMPLTNSSSPSMAQLLAAWRSNLKGVDTVAFLQNLHTKYNKPIWISDIAFHSFSGDNARPNDIFDMTVSLVANQQEQANEYDSLLTVLTQNTGPWFLGISCDSWNRFPADYTGTARYLNSPYGENIKGKLAETVLRQWFNGQRGWGGMQISGTSNGTNANLVLTANVTASSVDLGMNGSLYVAALLPGNAIYMLSSSGWSAYTGGTLPAHSNVILGTHTIPILTGSIDAASLSGTSIVVGYGTGQNDLLNNKKYSVIHTIQ